MTDQNYCATGCRLRGEHAAGCTGFRAQRETGAGTAGTDAARPDGTGDRDDAGAQARCTGCLPRAATHGRLCTWCWQRLTDDVAAAPGLVRYLWHLGEPALTSAPSVVRGRGGTPAAERSPRHPARDAADEVHACLAAWADLVRDEHPLGRRLTGPDENGARRTRTTTGLFEGEPVLRRSEVVGVHEPEATSRLVAWLLPLLTWCADQGWAGEMRREVGHRVRSALARFPLEERSRRVPGLPCPACGRPSLRYHPSTVERATAQVTCSRRACGRVYAESDFARLVRDAAEAGPVSA